MFQLHPSEVCNSRVHKLIPKVERGDYPLEPMDGPNLWRLKSGDRVAWVGAERPERRSLNGILAILDCSDCAVAVGEGKVSNDCIARSWGMDRNVLRPFRRFGAA